MVLQSKDLGLKKKSLKKPKVQNFRNWGLYIVSKDFSSCRIISASALKTLWGCSLSVFNEIVAHPNCSQGLHATILIRAQVMREALNHTCSHQQNHKLLNCIFRCWFSTDPKTSRMAGASMHKTSEVSHGFFSNFSQFVFTI